MTADRAGHCCCSKSTINRECRNRSKLLWKWSQVVDASTMVRHCRQQFMAEYSGSTNPSSVVSTSPMRSSGRPRACDLRRLALDRVTTRGSISKLLHTVSRNVFTPWCRTAVERTP
eukprot:7375919-Prymnesium_polylepis.2